MVVCAEINAEAWRSGNPVELSCLSFNCKQGNPANLRLGKTPSHSGFTANIETLLKMRTASCKVKIGTVRYHFLPKPAFFNAPAAQRDELSISKKHTTISFMVLGIRTKSWISASCYLKASTLPTWFLNKDYISMENN